MRFLTLTRLFEELARFLHRDDLLIERVDHGNPRNCWKRFAKIVPPEETEQILREFVPLVTQGEIRRKHQRRKELEFCRKDFQCA